MGFNILDLAKNVFSAIQSRRMVLGGFAVVQLGVLPQQQHVALGIQLKKRMQHGGDTSRGKYKKEDIKCLGYIPRLTEAVDGMNWCGRIRPLRIRDVTFKDGPAMEIPEFTFKDGLAMSEIHLYTIDGVLEYLNHGIFEESVSENTLSIQEGEMAQLHHQQHSTLSEDSKFRGPCVAGAAILLAIGSTVFIILFTSGSKNYLISMSKRCLKFGQEEDESEYSDYSSTTSQEMIINLQ